MNGTSSDNTGSFARMNGWEYIAGHIVPLALLLLLRNSPLESGNLRYLFLVYLVSTGTLALFARDVWMRLGRRSWTSWLLAVPGVDVFAQYTEILPLGRLLASEVKRRKVGDTELGDGFSKVSCYLYTAATAIILLTGFVGVAYDRGGRFLFMLGGTLSLLRLLVNAVMFYNYSQVANALAGFSSVQRIDAFDPDCHAGRGGQSLFTRSAVQ